MLKGEQMKEDEREKYVARRVN